MLVIGDSILKLSEKIWGAQIRAYRGAKIKDIKEVLEDLDISMFRIIILHVGTNNLKKQSVHLMMTDMEDLLDTIRRKSTAEILISAILPKFKQYADEDGRRKMYNEYIRIMAELWRVEVIPTFRTFEYRGETITTLFAFDGLHLKPVGADRLKKYIIPFLRSKRADLGLGPADIHSFSTLVFERSNDKWVIEE